MTIGAASSRRWGQRPPQSADIIAAMHVPAWRFPGASSTQGTALQLLAAAVDAERSPAPWRIQLEHTHSGVYLFEVRLDGSVHAFLREGLREIWPARSVAVHRLPVLGAHQGAGATVWAQILGGREVLGRGDVDGRPLIVARSTLAGVDAAKRFSTDAGVVLLVADAAGSVSPEVRRAIRVLSGAVPIVRVPWVPALRGMIAVPDSTAIKKAAARVAAAVHEQWREHP